jgi:hypothetical protein
MAQNAVPVPANPKTQRYVASLETMGQTLWETAEAFDRARPNRPNDKWVAEILVCGEPKALTQAKVAFTSTGKALKTTTPAELAVIEAKLKLKSSTAYGLALDKRKAWMYEERAAAVKSGEAEMTEMQRLAVEKLKPASQNMVMTADEKRVLLSFNADTADRTGSIHNVARPYNKQEHRHADGYMQGSRPTRGYPEEDCDIIDPNHAQIFVREHPLEGRSNEEKVAAVMGRQIFPSSYTRSAIASSQPAPPNGPTQRHWQSHRYVAGQAPPAGNYKHMLKKDENKNEF